MKNLFKYSILLIFGGVIYYFIELLYRGFSHQSMILVGGLCFICIGLLNEFYSYKTSLINQMIISSIIITIIEFISGLILNVWLKLNIWDYSKIPFNLLGQISLRTSIIWFVLALPAIILDDYLRYWMFKEEKPNYKLL